jgi:putative peptidoglycan binding protein
MIRVGDQSDTVRAIQQLLRALGYVALVEVRQGDEHKLVTRPIDVDKVFGPQTETALMDFQRDEGILVDGVVGPQTMRALEAAYTRHNLEVNSPGPDALTSFLPTGQPISQTALGAPAQRLPFVRVEADCPAGYLGGFPALQLRADVAQRYETARAELKACGAWLAIEAGKRALDAPIGVGRSAVSMHYLGRAFDLCAYSGMVDPALDSYVIELPDKGRMAIAWREKAHLITDEKEAIKQALKRPEPWHWQVWARCTGEASAWVQERQIDNVVTYLDRRGEWTKPVRGRFINLTELLGSHGFKPKSPNPRFFDFRGNPIYADWWHFQVEDGLIPNVSTFGGELLRIYSEATLAGTKPWENRHKVFDVDWG